MLKVLKRAGNIEYGDIKNGNIKKMGTSKKSGELILKCLNIVFWEQRKIPQQGLYNLS
jgi:hypothetical protein